ncbi:uncharacterized protein [Ptychodera flava]|uniref:uncharacterized protein n=1 Tax=Ptychodera flava TaxID=63121 RepID=UPI00396A8B73
MELIRPGNKGCKWLVILMSCAFVTCLFVISQSPLRRDMTPQALQSNFARLSKVLLSSSGLPNATNKEFVLQNVWQRTKDDRYKMHDPQLQSSFILDTAKQEDNTTKENSNDSQMSLRHHNRPIVPNIAHYTWFGNHTFRFDHLVSILSAHKFMKPDRIMFHTDCEPEGDYWEEAKEKLGDALQIITRKVPKTVFNNTIAFIQHSSDVARLEILAEHGGIYMDLDVIVLRSLTPLRHYDFVMGRESKIGLNNGIIVSSKDSEFLRLYHKGYRRYENQCWNCNSVLYPGYLAEAHPNLIHVEETSLVQPSHRDTDLIFLGHFPWWEGHYTIHTWIRVFLNRSSAKVKFTRENILSWDTAFGELCRYIYHGNANFVRLHHPDELFWTHDVP